MKSKTCMQFEDKNAESGKAGTALPEPGVLAGHLLCSFHEGSKLAGA